MAGEATCGHKRREGSANMKDFKDKVAVVTGGASGIGRAMAERFAAEGMKLVLADIEEGALASAQKEMEAQGATIIAVPTDVSRASDVEALARKTIDAFGAVHVLCNNAGVGPVMGASWELTEADWQWVLGINLWGALHGIRVFVPIMLDQDSEGHIVNTASMAGLLSAPWGATYVVAKHGIVALSESLHRELMMIGAKVNTRLMDGDRNRPAELQNEPGQEATSPQAALMDQVVRQLVATGTDPGEIGDLVLNAIRDERFYILPHPEGKEQVRGRMEDIIEERNPSTDLPFF
jgi:NAD(P)-dependent dehydrogenase (short-subunit alcohol dehydrogenase family)